MQLAEYNELMNGVLQAPLSQLEAVYEYGESRRGQWYSLPPMHVEYSPRAAMQLYGTQGVQTIAHAEASLILYGTDSADFLYEDDAPLLAAYKARRGITFLTDGNKFSRNAIHTIPGGCVSLIQRLPAYKLADAWTFDLAVYQRSHDLRTAGRTDPLMYAIIGNWVADLIRMRCGLIRWTDAHPHIYLDRSKIARRGQ